MKKNLVFTILIFIFLISGCGTTSTVPELEMETETVLGPIVKLETDPEPEEQSMPENDLYGFYVWDGCLSESQFFNGTRETPIYYLSEYEFIPILRAPYAFNPLSGDGIYYDVIVHTDGSEASKSPNIYYESAECDRAWFAEAGVDISGYQHCERFAATDTLYDYALYRMDDEIWLTGWWERGDENFIIRLRKDDHYELIPAVYKGNNVRLLRDLTAPHIPDITNPSMTKKDLLYAIGQTDDSHIVAYFENSNTNDWLLRYYGDDVSFTQQDDAVCFDEYRVMEYYDGALRYWFRYIFWDSPEHYEEAKKDDRWNNCNIQNDALLMTFVFYTYEDSLELSYRPENRALDYNEMLAALENDGFHII